MYRDFKVSFYWRYSQLKQRFPHVQGKISLKLLNGKYLKKLPIEFLRSDQKIPIGPVPNPPHLSLKL